MYACRYVRFTVVKLVGDAALREPMFQITLPRRDEAKHVGFLHVLRDLLENLCIYIL